jgi:hypothetical protein
MLNVGLSALLEEALCKGRLKDDTWLASLSSPYATQAPPSYLRTQLRFATFRHYSVDNLPNPTSAMAAVVSPLELCSFCRDAVNCSFVELGCKREWQSRRDFLEAQHKCYICTWFGNSLTSEALEHLPGNLNFSFEIDLYAHTCLLVSMERLVERVIDGFPLDLYFCSIRNTGMSYDRN